MQGIPALTPSRYPIAADGFHSQFPPLTMSVPSSFGNSRIPEHMSMSMSSRSSPRQDEPPQCGSPSDQFSTYPLHNWSYKQYQALSVLPSSVIPPLSYHYRPHRLEDVAPRDTILLIIALFFDFVYPLTPCVHKPSFMADIHAHREERDPLFFALVMATVASTLVQVPRSYLPMERHAVRKLAQTCHEASRHISVASYDPPTSMHVVVRYLYVLFWFFENPSPLYAFSHAYTGTYLHSDSCYHFCEGHDATQHAAFREAAHTAVTLRMHEESSYEGLDFIECEVRRRTFWLLFGGKHLNFLRDLCMISRGNAIRIDATLIANTSWLRAVLWAFTFALREEAVEQFGADLLPLLVFDDPQATFDAEHRHRWTQYVSSLQHGPSSAQVVLTTYDEMFLELIKIDGITGRQAMCAAAGDELGHIGIFEGESLDRKWQETLKGSTPKAAR